MQTKSMADYQPSHFLWSLEDGVATVTLNRPERKNPLTFDSYAELRDLFRELCYADDVHAVVIKGSGGNFSSGGDVHEIIGPLVAMDMVELMRFTRMTGDLVKAMRACPQVVIAAVEGVCAGAGAIIAMASDLRYGASNSKTAFPVHPRRPRRLRHGCLCDIAENNRPRSCERTFVQWPSHDG